MLLSVAILTYNHVGFIRQCIDSVLMQKTSFDYEIVIGDDCSTDGTRDILKTYAAEYPDRFVLLLGTENEGISLNYKKVLSCCKGKFVAICEGDDYWIDPLKLQIQVDFLRAHDEFGFVGCYNHILFPDGKIIEDKYNYLPRPRVEDDWELYGDVCEYAINGPVTRTVSICFRKSLIEPYIEYVGIGNDMVLQTILAKYSAFAKHSTVMCVYRQGGISTDRGNFEKKLYYNDWYVQNRLLQKRLFPDDCNWDEDELADRKTYILLKESVLRREVHQALCYKSQLRSQLYKKKSFSRYLRGPITCLLLSMKSRFDG